MPTRKRGYYWIVYPYRTLEELRWEPAGWDLPGWVLLGSKNIHLDSDLIAIGPPCEQPPPAEVILASRWKEVYHVEGSVINPRFLSRE